MAINLEQAKKRYKAGAASAGANYADGVRNTTGVIAKAIAAEELYAARMQESIANRSRAKGLAKVSDADWQRQSSGPGAQRIGQGMIAAADKQSSNYAPYAAETDSIVGSMPARTSDPATNVSNRVTPLAVGLRAKKKQLMG